MRILTIGHDHIQDRQLDVFLLNLLDDLHTVLVIHGTLSIGHQNDSPLILETFAMLTDHLNGNDNRGDGCELNQ